MKPVEVSCICLNKIVSLVLLSLFVSSCGSGKDISEDITEQIDSEPDTGQAIAPVTPPESLPEVIPVQEVPPTTLVTLSMPEAESPGLSNPVSVMDQESPLVSNAVPVSESQTVSIPVTVSDPETTPVSGPDQVSDPVSPTVSVPETEPVSELLSSISAEEISCDVDPEIFKMSLLELTNRSRQVDQLCGSTLYEAVQPLEWDDSLREAAHNHSTDMATHNFFSHTGSDGSRSSQRAITAGFPSGTIGENIAAGQRTAGIVQEGWVKSEGHCINIMRATYTHMGASCVVDTGANFQHYWTVVFGRK